MSRVRSVLGHATDALYDSYDAVRAAVAQSGSEVPPDLRVMYMDAVRLLAGYVADGDGFVTPREICALGEIFWLDGGAGDWAGLQKPDERPDLVEGAIDVVARAAALLPPPSDMDVEVGWYGRDELLAAVELVFHTVLAMDEDDVIEVERLSDVMERLRLHPTMIAAPDSAGDHEIAPADLSGGKEEVADLVNRARVFAIRRSMRVLAPAVEEEAAPIAPITATSDAIALTPVASPARLRPDETCYAVTAATLYQESNVTRSARYAGFSARIRIMRGLSYNMGRYALDRTQAPKIERIASGRLCVTDERLIFLSDVKNVDLPYARLLSTETRPGIIEVARPNSGRLMFETGDSDAIAVFEHLSGTSPEHRLDLEQQARTRPRRDNAVFVRFALLVVIVLVGLWFYLRQ